MDQRSEKRRAVLGRSRRRSRVVFAVIVSAAVLLTIPVFAWLYRQRSMETVTKVNMPYALFIGAGDAKPVQQLELSNIDVSGEQKSKDVVFCVYSKKPGTRYYLQLAHTTNIGFQYEIDQAELSDSGEISYLGKQYRRGAALTGSYLNRGSDGYATKQYHTETYGKYNEVQKAAEPLYWQTAHEEVLPETPENAELYINYYILHISWDESVQNNKETDMIYLMAG